MSFDGFRVQGSGFRVQGSGFKGSKGSKGSKGGGAAHKNREAPQNFDSASRRRHRKRSRGSFFALRSVLHKNWQGNDALVLRISAFTHASFIGLQERFLASLEMTIRESEIFQSLVTGHKPSPDPLEILPECRVRFPDAFRAFDGQRRTAFRRDGGEGHGDAVIVP